jgi:glycosyltransferase involved in cell wall biosynthesis
MEIDGLARGAGSGFPDWTMAPFISIIIPNRNGAATIGLCLEAVFASAYEPFEVIVVDDCSEDDSVAVTGRFPCTLIRLERHSGASAARNAGAARSRGELLFFTDADCLPEKNALAIASQSFLRHGPGVVVGGTYTPDPYDADFFSRFQSVFVNHSETRHVENADYAAAHAMVVAADAFRQSGGFAEDFLPVAEDVEFSHRLRRAGYSVVIEPRLLVRHIFGFSLYRSLRNAAFKALYWTIYSIRTRDILVDSGTASTELKANVVLCLTGLALLLSYAVWGDRLLLYAAALPFLGSILAGRGLIAAFFRTGGPAFGFVAMAYYLSLYPLAVGAGAFAGVVRYFVPARGQQKGG